MAKNKTTDLDRIGIFKEMDYLHGAVEGIPEKETLKSQERRHQRQMLSKGRKTKSGTQDGYFDKKFNRLFENELYVDFIKLFRGFRLKNAEKIIGKGFKPSNPTKLHSGVGSAYGTFQDYTGKRTEAFSALTREVPKLPKKKNVLVKPAAKGSGYGYPNVTINRFPDYFMPQEYEKLKAEHENPQIKKIEVSGAKKATFYLPNHPTDYLDKNPFLTKDPQPIYKEVIKDKKKVVPFRPTSPKKESGGSKGGCINRFPLYIPEPPDEKQKIDKEVKAKVFNPTRGVQPYPIYSIISTNVKKCVNINNYKTTNGVAYGKN